MAAIHLESVSKSYGVRRILNNLSLTVRHGECFTLLGPSGCGKTVLLRLIAGFELPDAGSIHIGESLVSDATQGVALPPDRRDLGVVFQDYAVWPHMTVFNNVAYPLRLAKTPEDELQTRVMECIALVSMRGLEQRLPSELSGGQQQRVALARALAGKPSLMLLDEPLSNLDANLREEMRFEIKELQHRLDITVLYVTHDQEVALSISDRMAVLDESGAIRQIGTPQEIFECPTDRFVFTFMGIANFMPVRREKGVYYVGKGGQATAIQPDASAGDTLLAAFRPSDVRIARIEAGKEPSIGTLHGTVRRAAFLGAMMDYLVEIDGAFLRTEVATHEAVTRNLLFREGEPCAVDFLSLHWFEAGDGVEATT